MTEDQLNEVSTTTPPKINRDRLQRDTLITINLSVEKLYKRAEQILGQAGTKGYNETRQGLDNGLEESIKINSAGQVLYEFHRKTSNMDAKVTVIYYSGDKCDEKLDSASFTDSFPDSPIKEQGIKAQIYIEESSNIFDPSHFTTDNLALNLVNRAMGVENDYLAVVCVESLEKTSKYLRNILEEQQKGVENLNKFMKGELKDGSGFR